MIAALFRTPEGSRYDRKVEKDSFSVNMKGLNSTLEESFSLVAGDTVDVSITISSGEVRLSVGKTDREPVYEGVNPEPNSFRISVHEDGDYIFSVSGNKAEGNISFKINKTDPP